MLKQAGDTSSPERGSRDTSSPCFVGGINTIFSRSINNNSYYYKYILTYLSSVSVKLSVKSITFSYLILYFHIMAFFKLSTVAHANVQ